MQPVQGGLNHQRSSAVIRPPHLFPRLSPRLVLASGCLERGPHAICLPFQVAAPEVALHLLQLAGILRR